MSRKHHEGGNKHKTNVKEFLSNVQKKKLEEEKQQRELNDQIDAIKHVFFLINLFLKYYYLVYFNCYLFLFQ